MHFVLLSCLCCNLILYLNYYRFKIFFDRFKTPPLHFCVWKYLYWSWIWKLHFFLSNFNQIHSKIKMSITVIYIWRTWEKLNATLNQEIKSNWEKLKQVCNTRYSFCLLPIILHLNQNRKECHQIFFIKQYIWL